MLRYPVRTRLHLGQRRIGAARRSVQHPKESSYRPTAPRGALLRGEQRSSTAADAHASPIPNSFSWGGGKRAWKFGNRGQLLSSGHSSAHKMVLMPTDALPRVLSTLPLVAGSTIRPTSLRVSSRRTVGYKRRRSGESRRPRPADRSAESYRIYSSMLRQTAGARPPAGGGGGATAEGRRERPGPWPARIRFLRGAGSPTGMPDTATGVRRRGRARRSRTAELMLDLHSALDLCARRSTLEPRRSRRTRGPRRSSLARQSRRAPTARRARPRGAPPLRAHTRS